MCPFLAAPEGFSAELLETLDQAFSAAWHDLQARGSPYLSAGQEQLTRDAIVKAVAELAATGVREPGRLKRHALHAAGGATPRGRLRSST
jgi:hypothetical protein